MSSQGTPPPSPSVQPRDETGQPPQKKKRAFGPGLLVTAAFIGPGTVTTATVAGASYGFALVWALVFAIAATMILQEMSARLGIVSRQGLGEALRSSFQNPAVKYGAIALVVAAIGFGNAAFQTGNLNGAGLALEAIFGGTTQLWAGIVGVAAFLLLLSGAYKVIERAVIVLVVLMSIVFIVTAIYVKPSIGDLFAGFVPTVPSGAILTVVALIGTTVVPYNLFLHASSVQQRWSDENVEQSLKEARTDGYLSIGLGGLITLAIVTTAAATIFVNGLAVKNAGDMATQLEPLLGPAAKAFFAVGLFSAGLTSAITAPLAAAFAVSGALGWEPNMKSARFRAIWGTVMVVGLLFAVIGTNPVGAIIFAQAANGLLLPIIVIFLLIVMNRSDLLGRYRNTVARNVLGVAVVVIATGLGLYNIAKALGFA